MCISYSEKQTPNNDIIVKHGQYNNVRHKTNKIPYTQTHIHYMCNAKLIWTGVFDKVETIRRYIIDNNCALAHNKRPTAEHVCKIVKGRNIQQQ